MISLLSDSKFIDIQKTWITHLQGKISNKPLLQEATASSLRNANSYVKIQICLRQKYAERMYILSTLSGK